MSETRRERNARIWQESEWEEVAAYLGPNAQRFRPAWERTREKFLLSGTGVAWSWCWPALIFGFAWFLYRRQWAIGAVLLLVPLGFALFLDRAPSLLGVMIVLAAMAKSVVVQDAVRKIAQIKETGGGMTEIAAAGGVSLAGGIVGGILFAIGAASVLVDILAIASR
ncbi:hypothetical protein ACMGDH_14195 [Sphingomonas sp. DT-207]|uniref:hypothetical protein n=1 Tax=Sphingomonas sp. DT-207 TaxID=3396167 RepID=UPI003F1DE6EA